MFDAAKVFAGNGAVGHWNAGKSTLWIALLRVSDSAPSERPWKPPSKERTLNAFAIV